MNDYLKQAIVNHYTTLRGGDPSLGHIAETSRCLGVSVNMLTTSLKNLKAPESSAKVSNGPEAEVFVDKVTSSNDCLKLVDERIVMGLAKTFKSQIIIKDRNSQTNKWKDNFHLELQWMFLQRVSIFGYSFDPLNVGISQVVRLEIFSNLQLSPHFRGLPPEDSKGATGALMNSLVVVLTKGALRTGETDPEARPVIVS